MLALPGKVFNEFGDQHLRQQVRTRNAARNLAARYGFLHHSVRPRANGGARLTLTAATGFRDPGNLPSDRYQAGWVCMSEQGMMDHLHRNHAIDTAAYAA
jgi:hypothetical protein